MKHMKQVLVFLALLISAPVVLYAQNQPVQNASMPKDAPVDVLATDFKNNPLNHEIIVFRSRINSREIGIDLRSAGFGVWQA